MTRSVVTLMHGDLRTSVYFHPLGVVMVAICVALAVADGWIWWHEAMTSISTTATWLLNRVMVTPAPWVR